MHPLIMKLLTKKITIEYNDCWEDEIIRDHMNIALTSYNTGDHTAGYGSSRILSLLAENDTAKQYFTNLAHFYLSGYCLMFEER